MKALREEKGISKREMTQSLGINSVSLWKIETGRVVPRPSTIEKFCRTLNIPLAYLYVKSFTWEDFLPHE